MALDFFAGCLGGCAGVLVGHPFDTVKESFRGLFKGMSSPMAGLSGVNAVVFGVYGNILRSSSSPNSLSNQFLAGSVAGCVQSLITSPMELAKTRMQLQGQGQALPYWRRPRALYKNPLDCLRKVFRGEGLRGVFRGLGCTVARDAPGFGVYFAGYEYLTRMATDSRGKVGTLSLLLVGGLAGVVSWVVVYPLDVLKSRLQADAKYHGLWDCVKKSYRAEGPLVFAKGLNSTIIRAFPTNAATFAVFTWVFVVCDSPRRASIGIDETNGVLLLDKEIQGLAC